MTDLPHHEALVGLLRHFRDRAYFPGGLYFFNPGHPNQLFYALAWALSWLVATDTACKLVIAGSQIAIIVFAARLARHLGTTRWTCLLVAPLTLGWMFFWGFVANLLGIAALLGVLPALDRFARAPTLRRAVVACGAILLLYFAHESAMVIGSAACVLFALGQPRSLRATTLRLTPALLGLLVAVGHQAYQARLLVPSLPLATIYGSILWKVQRAPNTLFGSHDIGIRLLLTAAACVAAAAFWVARARAGRPERPRETIAFLHHYRFEILGLFCLAGYLLAPVRFRGATMINDRFLAPAYAILVVTLAPPAGALAGRLALRALALSLPVALLLVVWPQFADADQCYRDLDRLLPQIVRGSAVAVVDNDPGLRTRTFSAASGVGRVMAERGGRMLFSFTRSPIAPAMMTPAYRWDEIETRLQKDIREFRPASELHHFRYVLVHSRTPQLLVLTTLALEPEAHLIDTYGEWVLLESKLKRPPAMSTEGSPPTLTDKTMGARVEEVARMLGAPGLPP